MAGGMGNEEKLRYWLFKRLCSDQLRKCPDVVNTTLNCDNNMMENALIGWLKHAETAIKNKNPTWMCNAILSKTGIIMLFPSKIWSVWSIWRELPLLKIDTLVITCLSSHRDSSLCLGCYRNLRFILLLASKQDWKKSDDFTWWVQLVKKIFTRRSDKIHK